MEGFEERRRWFRERVEALESEVGRVIVGQKGVVRDTISAILGGGHVLLEGVPGLGKTLLVRSLSQAMDLSYKRIQFTPDLMPADILGTTIILEKEGGAREFSFQKGPVFTQFLLADEINRATPRTQSALLEAMQEGSVTIGGVRHALQAPFVVLATQNPLEMEGTYPLPEAQLDRFMAKVQVPYPSLQEMSEVIERTTGLATPEVRRVVTGEELLEMRQVVRAVPVAEPVKLYGLRLMMATNPGCDFAPDLVKRVVRYGSSPRGGQALIQSARVHALLDGRGHVDYEDIRGALLPVLRHRVLINFEGEAEGLTSEKLLHHLLEVIHDVDPKVLRETR